jgi:DNA (cytosine-5)-methyltransferase 1
MKILNLYACLGGNRYKWGDDHEVTAVEWDTELARMYQERFPNDKVVVGDAHKYLLDHYTEYDFIWSSPPCPTHSRVRFANTKAERVYPEMSLYQEIIFLDTHFKGKYVVENVIPYYKPLIAAQKRGRHLYWANFNLPQNLSDRKVKVGSGTDEVSKLCDFHDIDLSTYKGKQRKDKVARNLVDYEAGKTILDMAIIVMDQENLEQTKLF